MFPRRKEEVKKKNDSALEGEKKDNTDLIMLVLI
jgi:hypothetical protein